MHRCTWSKKMGSRMICVECGEDCGEAHHSIMIDRKIIFQAYFKSSGGREFFRLMLNLSNQETLSYEDCEVIESVLEKSNITEEDIRLLRKDHGRKEVERSRRKRRAELDKLVNQKKKGHRIK